MSIRKRVRESLYGSSLFIPIRNGYQVIFDRETTAQRAAMRKFYSHFVHRGDVVFDIGANVGEYAEIFASLGAVRVIAVEPNPSCCEALYRLARMRNVRVEGCAVADTVGSAELKLCDNSGFSTLNQDWPETTKHFPSYQGVHWLKSITVPVVTLDALAQRHGIPAFVKIDVEGLEDKVLAGMSFRPASFSFEFNARVKQVALKCLTRPLLEGYRFNAIQGREFALFHPRWLSRDEVAEWLSSYENEGSGEYGDIFARRTE